MADLAEGFERGGADTPGGAVVAHEVGKTRLDSSVALNQRVVVGVRDFGCVLAVVELVVARDLGGQIRKLGLGLSLGEGLGRLYSFGGLAHGADCAPRCLIKPSSGDNRMMI